MSRAVMWVINTCCSAACMQGCCETVCCQPLVPQQATLQQWKHGMLRQVQKLQLAKRLSQADVTAFHCNKQRATCSSDPLCCHDYKSNEDCKKKGRRAESKIQALFRAASFESAHLAFFLQSSLFL